MPHKIVIITCEGRTEERVCLDLIDRKKLSLKIANIKDNYKISTKVVHPGVIDTWFNANKDNYDAIIFLVDKDVEVEVNRAESVRLQAKKLGFVFVPLFQDPHMETFFAACFEEFKIDEKLAMKNLKKSAEDFLIQKMELSHPRNLKKITIKKIQLKGGDTKNALRYENRFDILSLLK